MTPVSFYDLYGLLRENDWPSIYHALTYVNWFTFKHLYTIQEHTIKPLHTCCLTCRAFLAELGLFIHKLRINIRNTIKVLLQQYRFILTADNVDLNGIIDFEDYIKDTSQTIDRTLIVHTMAPFLYIFYGIYNSVGCYFISSPIYAIQPTTANILALYQQAISTTASSINIIRPAYDVFYTFLDLDIYLGIQPVVDLYNLYNNFILPEFPRGIGYHIYPCTSSYTTINDLRNSTTTIADCNIYVSVTRAELDANIDYLRKLAECNVLYTLINDHSIEADLHRSNLHGVLHFWARALYDANVNNAHFSHSFGIVSSSTAEFPIIGKCPAEPITRCNKCSDIPLELRAVYDLGCAHTLLRDIDFDQLNINTVNPLHTFDKGLLDIGALRDDSIYNYDGNLQIPYYVNWSLIDYFSEQGYKIKLPPETINEDDDIEHTYSTSYYIKQPVAEHILDDLNLFNLNLAGSIAPSRLLMSFEYVSFLFRDQVLTSNDLPNTPTTIFDVNIARKNKSSGIPYNRVGNIGFMMHLFGLYRQALINHRKHSMDQSITLVINKVAINTKYRDRTILAINATLSEQGRCCFRFMLEKIKASAKNGGPCLIGFSPQHLGWNNFYASLDDGFMCSSCTRRAGKDFPKYDRYVTSLLLYLSCFYFFIFVDPFQLQELADDSLDDIFHLYISEATQVIFNHLVALGHVYIKPAGQTSGGSRTADGNTMVHMTLDAAAIIEQICYVRANNDNLLRDMRDSVAEQLLLTPAKYCANLYMYRDWKDAVVPDIPIKPQALDEFYVRHGTNMTLRYVIYKSVYLSDDAVTNYDSRLVDYADMLKDFLLMSNYIFGKDKYHINNINHGIEEFLSQETFEYNGYYFPIPNCERIYAALFISNNPNTQDPDIDAARTVALYGILYPFMYTNGHERVKRFIELLGKYISANYTNIDFEVLNSLDLGLQLDTDLNVLHLNQRLDQLHGFDIATQHPLNKRIIDIAPECCTSEAGRTLLCVVCEQEAAFTCIACGLSFCNDGTAEAHALLHSKILNHYCYQFGRFIVRCACGVNDIRQLYYEQNRFYCEQHMTTRSNRFYYNVINFSSSSGRLRFDSICYEKLPHFLHSYCARDWATCIRFAMDMFYCGMYRPYYFLLHYITGLTDKALRKERDIVNVNSFSLKIDDQWHANVPSSTKFDERATYIADDGRTNSVVRITSVYVDHNDTFDWSFQCNFTPKQLIRIPFNILSTALCSLHTRVPLCAKALSINSLQCNLKTSMIKPIVYNCGELANDMPITTMNVFNMINRYIFSIVQGPPGCGKTYTAAHLLCLLRLANPHIRILVLGPSHKAVDVIFNQTLRILDKYTKSRVGIIRVHHDLDNVTSKHRQLYASIALQHHNLVFCTIQSNSVGTEPYDFILTDEFSQQSDLYIMLYAQRLRDGGSVVLFGDQCQLINVDEHRTNVKYSNLPCYIARNATTKPHEYPHFYMLTDHYRSHPTICNIISEYCYNNALTCKTDLYTLKLCELNRKDNLHAFRIVVYGAVEAFDRGICYNKSEINVCKALLLHVFNNTSRCGRVAILCAYKSQYNRMSCEVSAFCKEHNIAGVHVHTIDSVQGDEFDHVILALTRLNPFTLNINRFNVAVSRARSTLCVIEPKDRSIQLPSPFNKLPIFEHDYIVTESKLDCAPILKHAHNLRDFDINHYIQFNFDPSPLHADYVYFDCEFINVLKSYRANFALLLAFSVANNEHSHVSYGSPIVYDEQWQPFTLPIRDIASGPPRNWILQYVSELRDQQLHLIESVKQSRATCDIHLVLRFCIDYCLTRPIIVTWAGTLDLVFLIPIIMPDREDDVCAASKCGAPAFYYAMAIDQCFCQFHAKRNRSSITHFTRLAVYNMNSLNRRRVISLYATNFEYSYEYDCSKNSLKLSEAHSLTTCTINHGNAHDPDVDVAMTRCVFSEFFFPILAKQDFCLNVQPAHYSPEISRIRHGVIDHHLKNVSGTICELGGGNRPRANTLHNVDINCEQTETTITEDMNTHHCDADFSIYCDSVYYLSQPLSKDSYIFYDGNPKHYRRGIDGNYYYVCGRHCLYKCPKLPSYVGENVFLRFPRCGANQRSVVLRRPIVACNSQTNFKYNICDVHYAQYQLIYNTSVLMEFGYVFVFCRKSILAVAESMPDYSKQNLELPGYELRQQKRGNRTTRKGLQLVNIVNKYLSNYNSLPINCRYVCFGAAGANGTFPMAKIFSEYFRKMYKRFVLHLVDPRFTSTALNGCCYLHAATIREYMLMHREPTFFVISDAYCLEQNHIWFNELTTFIDTYLIKQGVVLLKITHSLIRLYGYDKIDKLASYFNIANVFRLNMDGVSSELWLLLVDYNRENKVRHALGDRINSVWFDMERGKDVLSNHGVTMPLVVGCLRPWSVNLN